LVVKVGAVELLPPLTLVLLVLAQVLAEPKAQMEPFLIQVDKVVLLHQEAEAVPQMIGMVQVAAL
jgi:hypothetical protein